MTVILDSGKTDYWKDRAEAAETAAKLLRAERDKLLKSLGAAGGLLERAVDVLTVYARPTSPKSELDLMRQEAREVILAYRQKGASDANEGG